MWDSLAHAEPDEWGDLSKFLHFVGQGHLARIGYLRGPIDVAPSPGLREAVQSFEKARGLGVTGDLLSPMTYWTWAAEVTALERIDRLPMAPVPTFQDSWDLGLVTASGYWIMEPVRSAYTEVVHIECDRPSATCRIAYARLGPDGSMMADLVTYEVATWDDAEIRSRPLDYTCTRYLLVLNRVQESVSLVRSTIDTAGVCAAVSREDMRLRLATYPEADSALNRPKAASLARYLNLTPGARAWVAGDTGG